MASWHFRALWVCLSLSACVPSQAGEESKLQTLDGGAAPADGPRGDAGLADAGPGPISEDDGGLLDGGVLADGGMPTDAGAPVDGGADGGPSFVVDPDSLRAQTDSDLPLVGAAVNASALAGDEAYALVLGREFNAVTPENVMKWDAIHPEPNTYDYVQADALVDFAEAHGQTVKGHVLVWHAQLPAWVLAVSGQALEAAIVEHIETIVTRYAGRIDRWDVVNEVFEDGGPSLRDTHFLRQLGPGFVDTSFRAAAAANPNAELIYNDFSILAGGAKADAAYAMVSSMVQRGVPIHGVGFQSHLGPERSLSAYNLRHGLVSEQQIRQNIRRFGELGLSVYLSEVDVQTKDLAMDDAQKNASQRDVYRMLANICGTESACKEITFLGSFG